MCVGAEATERFDVEDPARHLDRVSVHSEPNLRDRLFRTVKGEGAGSPLAETITQRSARLDGAKVPIMGPGSGTSDPGQCSPIGLAVRSLAPLSWAIDSGNERKVAASFARIA